MAGGPRAAASGEYLVVPYAMAMEKKACSLAATTAVAPSLPERYRDR